MEEIIDHNLQDKFVTVFQMCPICTKDMGMAIIHVNRGSKPTYCYDCIRAVKVARMMAGNTLPSDI